MTKSRHILALYNGRRTTAEIAKIVGCSTSYVRVVARQRRGTSSAIDMKYNASAKGEARRARQRPSLLAHTRALYQTADMALAVKKGRAAYRAARRVGKTADEARRAYAAARMRVICRTGNYVAARAAYRAARIMREAAE